MMMMMKHCFLLHVFYHHTLFYLAKVIMLCAERVKLKLSRRLVVDRIAGLMVYCHDGAAVLMLRSS